ncbi:MAG TPA: hypothetical protein VGY91_08660 [Chthoniobacterales bacterium]|nr:hypothetical protein [Chthoniobacterales bacterium]
MNYLAGAQIYLRDNVMLREPLKPEHIKDRLLPHWGTHCQAWLQGYLLTGRHGLFPSYEAFLNIVLNGSFITSIYSAISFDGSRKPDAIQKKSRAGVGRG